MERLPTYQPSPVEKIDDAIGVGDFVTAREQIESFIRSNAIYDNLRLVFHVQKIILGMPMLEAAANNKERLAVNERLDFNIPTLNSEQLKDRIVATYSKTVGELNTMYGDLHDHRMRVAATKQEIIQNRHNLSYTDKSILISEANQVEKEYIGNMSELSFFALMTRGLTGDGSDLYTVTPASYRKDLGYRDTDGLRRGTDFFVQRIDNGEELKVQVKTTDRYNVTDYADDIKVITLTSLLEHKSPINTPTVNDLYQALIDDNDRNSTPQQHRLIELATTRLHRQLGLVTPTESPQSDKQIAS